MGNEISIAICDDDYSFVKLLAERVNEIIKNNDYACRLSSFVKAADLIDYCENDKVDIVLSDIDMPDTTGFQLATEMQRYNKDVEFIYVTAHEELAYQAYEYNPFSFVFKGDLERLNRVLKKLIKHKTELETRDTEIELYLDRHIKIDVKKVVYLDSYKNYVVAHTLSGDVYSFRATIKDVYEILKDKGFISVQRGFIANCRFIKIYNDRYIILATGEQKTMTRDPKKIIEARRIYERFMR